MNMIHNEQPLTRRERKRIARIESIVDVAMEITAGEGLGQVTTHRVAKELDLAVGALYRYFSSKDAIIEAMQRRSLEDYSNALRRDLLGFHEWQVANNVPPSPLGALIAIAFEYRRLVQVLPQHYHLNNQVMGNPKNVLPGSEGDRVVEVMMSLFRTLATHVQEAQDQGSLDRRLEPLDAVILYWSSLRAVLGVQKLQAHDPSIEGSRLFRDMVFTMLLGCGAQEDELHAGWAIAHDWQLMKEGESA